MNIADDKNKNLKNSDQSNNDTSGSIKYFKEFWTGDSKDGSFCDGEGYHYYRMKNSLIVEAYEYYENDEGVEVVTPYPEMHNVDWFQDIGFDNFEALDEVTEQEFNEIKELLYH